MKALGVLFVCVLSGPGLLGKDVNFYGLKLSASTRVSGVVKITLADFPWLTTRNVQSEGDLERLLRRRSLREDGSYRPVKPAIVYLASQPADSGLNTVARMEHLNFCQKDVKERLDAYRWYWTYVNTTAGRLLMKTYQLTHKTALLVFQEDGSILHIEAPISGPKSVAHALRMVDDKHRMEAAVKADLPFLRNEYGAGNYKTVVKYLLHGERYKDYATPWTKAKFEEMRSAVSRKGEEAIKRAEELASAGQRQEAFKILTEVKREFRPLEPSEHADEVAKQLRRQ